LIEEIVRCSRLLQCKLVPNPDGDFTHQAEDFAEWLTYDWGAFPSSTPLQGRVTLLLDEAEVPLKPFDVVVQRGTNHYWLNAGPDPALLMGVLLDAR
jgi:hypothetical protein